MTTAGDLTKMVPGFDFLQNLMKGASSGLAGIPGMGQWVAPTLDPAELDKRIQELKTVQFWLEQNARLLATTIQALEVQRMTLATLQTMNLPMADLRNALKIDAGKAAAAARASVAAQAQPEPAAAAPATPAASASTSASDAEDRGAPAAPAVDPLQWWGALTQQFTELATKAVKDGAAGALAGVGGMKVAAAAPEPTAAPAAKKPAPGRAAPRKRSL